MLGQPDVVQSPSEITNGRHRYNADRSGISTDKRSVGKSGRDPQIQLSLRVPTNRNHKPCTPSNNYRLTISGLVSSKRRNVRNDFGISVCSDNHGDNAAFDLMRHFSYVSDYGDCSRKETRDCANKAATTAPLAYGSGYL